MPRLPRFFDLAVRLRPASRPGPAGHGPLDRRAPLSVAILSLLMIAGFASVQARAQDSAGPDVADIDPTQRSDALFPKPALVSPAWQLDFDFELPRALAVRSPRGGYDWYWYLRYRVTNPTDEVRYFAPEFTLVTDRGDIFPANFDIPATVFKAIKDRHGDPLLESPIKVIGNLLAGEDFAKESVVIWPAIPPKPDAQDDTGSASQAGSPPVPVDIDRLSLFITGLSGEVARFKHPLTEEVLLLRRTLQLDFAMPGNPQTPQDQIVNFLQRSEVMR